MIDIIFQTFKQHSCGCLKLQNPHCEIFRWKYIKNESRKFYLGNKKLSAKIKPFPQRWLTAQKVKFSIKDFFSKCDQIRPSCLVIKRKFFRKLFWKILTNQRNIALLEIRIFPHFDYIRTRKTPYADTFQAVLLLNILIMKILEYIQENMKIETNSGSFHQRFHQ